MVIAAVICVLLASSFPPVRGWFAAPLCLSQQAARGDACYVLAGGGSLQERLDAAADLIQMGRVRTILLMRDDTRSQYSFKAQSSWTRSRWASDYLAWRGIPPARIRLLPTANGPWGTLAEARMVTGNLPKEITSLVLVSSAPHMRRATLAFRRSLPERVRVTPYAASGFGTSFELYHPIWLEYLKLGLYWVIA